MGPGSAGTSANAIPLGGSASSSSGSHGLGAFAKSTHLPGACAKCGQTGHLAYQCRNTVTIDTRPPHERRKDRTGSKGKAGAGSQNYIRGPDADLSDDDQDEGQTNAAGLSGFSSTAAGSLNAREAFGDLAKFAGLLGEDRRRQLGLNRDGSTMDSSAFGAANSNVEGGRTLQLQKRLMDNEQAGKIAKIGDDTNEGADAAAFAGWGADVNKSDKGKDFRDRKNSRVQKQFGEGDDKGAREKKSQKKAAKKAAKKERKRRKKEKKKAKKAAKKRASKKDKKSKKSKKRRRDDSSDSGSSSDSDSGSSSSSSSGSDGDSSSGEESKQKEKKRRRKG